ncbi:SDR family oxidoreductase [Phenylobacterium sp.]|jgi:NAD(P)-dependent dehydrogenase (short-subunit alcohol dehydrogenase family)|uniref:SDR family NAD(P)-dependent oxidoreductase n=1 Tax=Phenylobacterium sp. TaxID=1871053 RepID=UPI000C996F98|nr:SDR family oxidoreductase [Phenylobacterium sp.]MAK81264.1 short-chain dehydrogenase [Phenylobacterium sp.]|tara:strand:- start:30448 stop:31317 length:870 start_codon:yes stop_codon:yes gene_type:complete
MSDALTSRRALIAGGAGLAALAAQSAVAADLKTPPEAAAALAANGRFAGKVVLITGATSGIGRATARAFALEGAKVMFCGRREGLGAEVETEIRGAGGEARYRRADVRVEADVAALVDACVQTYGGLDIAFNNAGIAGRAGGLGPEFDWAVHNDIMATNLEGVVRCINHQVPALKARGGGAIINTASVLGYVGSGPVMSYALSKAGVLSLTRSAALQLAGDNIRVNAVSPGPIDTPMMGGGAAQASGARTPAGRAGQPEEVAHAVMYLADSAASYVTGEDLKVDGGVRA